MKKVLIITYYWPPMGGGGVQRWLKFSKYLRDFGWEPIIYTPKNADVVNYDQTLEAQVPTGVEVIRTDIWEPFNAYKRLLGKSKEEKIQPGFLQESDSNDFLQKIAVWVRGNLFVPDAKKFWIKPSIKYLKKYLIDNDIDVVISTGPPHSNHLIAKGLKKTIGIKWLADFRDPWTNIDYYDKLMLSSWADRKHHKLEKQVIMGADEVVTVSQSWASDFEKLTGIMPTVITNGYDSEDFDFIGDNETTEDQLNIIHIGSLNADRNPHSFWKALHEIKEEGGMIKSMRIMFIGPTDVSVFNEVEANGLSELISHKAHMSHKEVLKYLVSADALLLPLNDTPNIDGVIPGKLYEYLASRRPIIAIGKPDGDASKIITETRSGRVFDFEDWQGIKNYMIELLQLHEGGKIPQNSSPPDKYSRKVLAGEICKILDRISSN